MARSCGCSSLCSSNQVEGFAPLKSQFGIFTTDLHLVIRTWDAWLEKVTSRRAADVCGNKLPEMFPEIESRGLMAPFQRALEQGAVELLSPALHGYLIECPAPAKSTRFRHMQQRTVIAPQRENSKIIGLVVTIEDVTSRREGESQGVAALSADDWRTRRQAVEQIRSRPVPVVLDG